MRRPWSAQFERALKSKHIDDQQAQASAVRLAVPTLFCLLLPDITDRRRGVAKAAHGQSAADRICISLDLNEWHWNGNSVVEPGASTLRSCAFASGGHSPPIYPSKGRSRLLESGAAADNEKSRRVTMAGFIYRGAGKARRRMRRARLRVFTNVRTATRNLDLPLAIRESPIACQPFPTGIGRLRPVQGCNMAVFFPRRHRRVSRSARVCRFAELDA